MSLIANVPEEVILGAMVQLCKDWWCGCRNTLLVLQLREHNRLRASSATSKIHRSVCASKLWLPPSVERHRYII